MERILPAPLRRPAAAVAVCAVALVLAAALAPRGNGAAIAKGPIAPAAIPRPAIGLDVADADALRTALLEAPEGSTLRLAPGDYLGPFRVERSLQIWGPPEAVIRSSGDGTTLRLLADGAALRGVTVDGSGGRYDLTDAAVYVSADDVTVEGVTVINAVFSVVVEKSNRAVVRGCRMTGTGEPQLGIRGDGLRVWETRDSVFAENVIESARDVVVWYSSNNQVVGNLVRDCRYGTHFMYSHGNEVHDNVYIGNTVGMFAMYSEGLDVRGNVFADSAGSAGMGIGLKESSAVTIDDNSFVHDTIGLYFDNSPFTPGTEIIVRGNDMELCETAIKFHGPPKDCSFIANALRDNTVQVVVGAGGDASAVNWEGNAWDDYQGYDLDGDGFGDLPYESRSLQTTMMATTPELAFLRGTPLMNTLDAVGRILPLYAPKALLVDARPAIGAAGRQR